MNLAVKKLARTAQTWFPALVDAKAQAQRLMRRCLRKPFEADFRALGLFPGSEQLCIDVGGNRGQSIDAIRLMARRPRIVSFEPNPLLAARLAARWRGRSDVRIETFALGAQPGRFQLHVPRYRGFVFDGLASLDRDAAMGWLSAETVHGFDPALLDAAVVDCEVRRLDDFGLAPFFVKLDIQGFELPALIGARHTLRTHRPLLMVESAGEEIPAYLRELGYRQFHWDGAGLSPGRGPGPNSLFVTADKLALCASDAPGRSRRRSQPEPA